MSSKVSKSQFKAKALEFFRQVESGGEPLIITDRGEPRLEIRPYKPSDRDPLEVLRGSVLHYNDPFASAEEDWEAIR